MTATYPHPELIDVCKLWVLLYPPRSEQEQGPIDSVRWELFREGLEDYEYLCLAERLANELAMAGNTALADRGRAAIDRAFGLVQKWPNVKAANEEPYTLDVTAIDHARTELATTIEEMFEAIRQG